MEREKQGDKEKEENEVKNARRVEWGEEDVVL